MNYYFKSIIDLILSVFRRSKEDTKLKLKEITNMRLQLDRNLDESNEYKRKLDLSTRDSKRLQDDLTALQRENQVCTLHNYYSLFISCFYSLHQELQHTIADKENLKLQVQEYIKQINNCENVIAQKVKLPSLSLYVEKASV